MTDTPPPGSDAAHDAGCLCPRMDNAGGRGYMGGARDEHGNVAYVIDLGCPMHAPDLTTQPEGI